ncbi:MAG: prenyltransferase [Oscillospiraceae bacterium]
MNFKKLTARAALNLAASHTWPPSSVLTVIYGSLLALFLGCEWSTLIFCAVLAISVLMQSAVNTLNDYHDFVKGTDTEDNSADPTDAVLVYGQINPKSALQLGIGFLVLAALIGMLVVMKCGAAPLIVGLAGGVCVVAYSSGVFPLSYMPAGEVVSGFVMGGLIPLGVVASFSGKLDFAVLLYSLPFMAGISLIMLTNNTCDIERDRTAGRKTLGVMVGLTCSRWIYRIGAVFWLACVLFVGGWMFPEGAFALPIGLCFGMTRIAAIFKAELFPERRDAAMSDIIKANMFINGSLAASLAAVLIFR